MKFCFDMQLNLGRIDAEMRRGGIHFVQEAAQEFGDDLLKFINNHPFVQACTMKTEYTQKEKKALLKKRPTPRPPLKTPERDVALSTPERRPVKP